MTTKLFTVSLELSVHDTESLRQAAELRAINDGLTAYGWKNIRASESNPIAADIQMLLDPGTLPGCDIKQSSVESVSQGGFWSDEDEDDPETSLDDQRIAVADSEFDKFDFGQWEIEQSHFGEWEIDQNTLVRAARAYPSPLSEPVKMIFTVTFFPESAEVQDTDCTVDGNEIIPTVE